MYKPIVIVNNSFQQCWFEAVKFLSENSWEWWNLVIQISNPAIFDATFNKKVCDFAKTNELITSPKGVAYTIFPHKQYKGKGTAQNLYYRYIKRFYPWLKKQPHFGWGTYFHRMIHYESGNENINQLNNIIQKINTRINSSRSAYTIVIEKPGNETIRPMGAPCLNYIAIQIEFNPIRKIGMLCTYRNHYFLERAYGNYWGLCNLLIFLAYETNSITGPITCISSHAIVSKKKKELRKLLRSFS